MKWGKMEEKYFFREIARMGVSLARKAQGKHEYSKIFGPSATLLARSKS